MPKKSKTRKQKILTDLRKNASPIFDEKVDFTTYSLPKQKTAFKPKSSTSIKANSELPIATASYSYLASDLRKTLLLTTFIIITQLVLKFILKI